MTLLVAFAASRSVRFDPPITPQKRHCLQFQVEPLSLDLRTVPEVHGIASPFRTSSGDKAGYPETPLAEMAPGNAQQEVLLHSHECRTQNSHHKRTGRAEGDRFEGSRIARIEKTRVL